MGTKNIKKHQKSQSNLTEKNDMFMNQGSFIYLFILNYVFVFSVLILVILSCDFFTFIFANCKKKYLQTVILQL